MVTYTELQEVFLPAPTAVAVGFFDGVHLGHRRVLDTVIQLKAEGLSSAVFSYTVEEHIPQAKVGFSYLRTATLKQKYLEALGVDFLMMPPFDSFCSLSAEEFARDILHGRMQARVVCCGSDLRYGKHAAADAKQLQADGKRFGFEVRIVEPVCVGRQKVSSSRIREYIRQGAVDKANELLDRPFAFDFEVVRGNQLGRTIDSPTINQVLPERFIIPKFGVYASVAVVHGKLYPAVTNVGVKPTIGSDKILAETHIIGFEDDLYGQHVEVRLLKFTRPEQKFPGVPQLKAQIAKDTQNSIDTLKKIGGICV